jgi:serine/threonine-protein kinase
VTAALTGGTVVATLATWVIMRPTPPARSQPIRFTVATPPAQSLVNGNAQLVVSPDGRTIVWVTTATGGTQLMVRALDELDAVPLRGSVNARLPFFSPDGKWVGFFADRELKKVSIAGGAAITVCRFAGVPRGASWGPDDTIIFSTGDTTTGLLRVPAGGGDPTMLTKPDEAGGEASYISPMILPGGRAVLFTIVAKGTPEKRQIAVLDLKTARRKILIRSGSHATYVDSGHIVFEDAGALLAAPFDLARLEVLSDPVAVVEQVLTVLGTPAFSVSPHGTLVYAPGGMGVAGAGAPRSLLWIDRRGGEEPIKLPLRTYTYPRLSPDGLKVAVDIRDQENDIWIADLTRLTLTRLTIDPANDFYPVWTPNGRRIIFNSNRAGAGDLFWQAADGTGTVERLTTTTNGPHYPYSISTDGLTLIYQDNQPKTGIDLSLVLFESLSTDGPHKLQSNPLIQTAFSETNAEISPDGHWLAYQSNESGKDEVYVRPFPNVDGGRWQISDGGGTRPLWARSGHELFYLDASGFLMATSVQTTPVFTAGNPTKVLNTRYFSGFGGTGQAVAGRTYDVSPDGKRFLMIKDNVPGGQSSTASVVVVVVGWQEELKQRVPVK